MGMNPENGSLPPPPAETPGKHHVEGGIVERTRGQVIGIEKLLILFGLLWWPGKSGPFSLAPEHFNKSS